MTKPQTVVAYDPNNPKHKQLKDAMKDICRQGNQSTLSIWISVSQALARSPISPKPTVEYILLQGYQQGLAALEQGEPIGNPMAWLRLESYRIIRELTHDC